MLALELLVPRMACTVLQAGTVLCCVKHSASCTMDGLGSAISGVIQLKRMLWIACDVSQAGTKQAILLFIIK